MDLALTGIGLMVLLASRRWKFLKLSGLVIAGIGLVWFLVGFMIGFIPAFKEGFIRSYAQ